MNKKVIVIGLVVLLAVAAMFGYTKFFGPDTQKGAKEVTVEIVIEGQSIDKSYTFNTDTELLMDLLTEVKDEIKFESLDSSFGPMVVGLEGYTANPASEYFHIIINGADAMVGVKDIPVADGDVYHFEIRNF